MARALTPPPRPSQPAARGVAVAAVLRADLALWITFLAGDDAVSHGRQHAPRGTRRLEGASSERPRLRKLAFECPDLDVKPT